MFAEAKPVAWSGDRRHWQKALAGPQPPGAAYLPLLMDHRVLAHYDGDVTRANIAPRKRRRILAAYGGRAAAA